MKAKLGKYQKNNRRKIDIHIDSSDTWSAYYTIALIALPILLQIREEKMGVPAEFGDVLGNDYDSQMSFDFVKEDHDWAFEEKIKEWDNTLNKMIWSFQQIVHDDYDELYHHGVPKYSWKKLDEVYTNPITNKQEGLYEMVDENPDEHWYDIEGHTLHNERIKEGLILFGKYFQNLWD